METAIKTKKIRISGMTCVNCQNTIENKLRNTAGVQKADVSYSAGTAVVTYDTDILSLEDISRIIEKLGYKVPADNQKEVRWTRAAGILISVVALYVVFQHFGLTQLFSAFPLAEAGMGYGMLFVIGLITSVHCVAMCGGINLSQCMPKAPSAQADRFSSIRPSLLYNLGRVISYTVVGALVGALGSAISFSGAMKGAVQLIAGVFMAIMGITMLGLFPSLRKFTPRMPKIFAQKINAEKARSRSPLYVGLLNGLMPCGPLQAMQLYALSTGSPAKGALSMLLFSLGTVPLMFGLGALSSLLTKKFNKRIMTAGGVLVLVLGVSMFSNGWSLSGFALGAPVAAEGESAAVSDNVQVVNTSLKGGRYPAITVQAGIPVRWTIEAPKGSITGCNNRLYIPAYNIEKALKVGDNVIEFMPTETGKFPYSCWMGMIRSSITVVEAGTQEAGENVGGSLGISSQEARADYQIPTGSIAVATVEGDTQQVKIDITDSGFSPAVIVLQAGIEAEWIINNQSASAEINALSFPYYSTQLPLQSGENPLYVVPDADFDFSTVDNAFYGYVKVVDDIDAVDTEAIKEEVSAYRPVVWSDQISEELGANCCQ